MQFLEIVFIAVSLSMDAFAVAMCKGLSMKRLNVKNMIIIGLFFGVFQMIMPILGYYLGKTFESYIVNIDHWIAFGLLFLLGSKAIFDTFKELKESKKELKENTVNDDLVKNTKIFENEKNSTQVFSSDNCDKASDFLDSDKFNFTIEQESKNIDEVLTQNAKDSSDKNTDEILHEKSKINDRLNYKELFIMAIATSIDALAVGITFALTLNNGILLPASLIGIITFLISVIGVIIGHKFGNKGGFIAKFLGGAVLIIIGIKILIEHLFFM